MGTEKTKSRRKTQVQTETRKMTFEEALENLEKIIIELERDDLTLDNALYFFEKGIHLVRRCDTHLKNAQGRIRELFKGENGEFVEKILGMTLESFSGEDEE